MSKKVNTLLNCIQFPVIILKTDFSILGINQAALNIYGWHHQNPINKNIFTLCHTTNAPPPATPETLKIASSLANSSISCANMKLFNPEASAKWDVFCSANIVERENVFVLGARPLNNKLLGLFQKDNFEHLLSRSIFSLLKHISLATKKDAIKSLTWDFQQLTFNSNVLLSDVIKLLPGEVYWENQDLKYMGCNDYCAEVIGLTSPRDLINQDDLFIKKMMSSNYPEAAYELWQKTARDVIQNNMPLINMKDLTYNHPTTGETISLCTSKIPIIDNTGNIAGLLGISINQNDPKHMHQILHANSAIHQMLDISTHKSILNSLCTKEFECIELSAAGKSIKQIAFELNLPIQVVKTHLNNAKLKTKTTSINQLIDLYQDYCGNNTNLEKVFH
ncbi:MAG: PAS domain-containing protein [Gammaproteobacteria bacterium]|nr:PAS domain-containing protein [Gammaproteobacteria bacterium]